MPGVKKIIQKPRQGVPTRKKSTPRSGFDGTVIEMAEDNNCPEALWLAIHIASAGFLFPLGL